MITPSVPPAAMVRTGKRVGIAVAAHLRQCDPPHGGGGGDAGAADRAEDGAAADRGHRQAAPQMTDEGRDEAVEGLRKSRHGPAKTPMAMKSGTIDSE